MQGFQGREGRVALVLLNLCHPEDDEGDYLEAKNRALVEWWNHSANHGNLRFSFFFEMKYALFFLFWKVQKSAYLFDWRLEDNWIVNWCLLWWKCMYSWSIVRLEPSTNCLEGCQVVHSSNPVPWLGAFVAAAASCWCGSRSCGCCGGWWVVFSHTSVSFFKAAKLVGFWFNWKIWRFVMILWIEWVLCFLGLSQF